uniref:Uncharacterized protein n=1 Tax=Anguilla anguilla TaxID=7936 RepID=A0A0E9R677_ANGAN
MGKMTHFRMSGKPVRRGPAMKNSTLVHLFSESLFSTPFTCSHLIKHEAGVEDSEI